MSFPRIEFAIAQTFLLYALLIVGALFLVPIVAMHVWMWLERHGEADERPAPRRPGGREDRR
jgi:hypothetical protein